MTEISRIEILCEDKNVGRIQRLLAGVGILSIKSMPVSNAKVEGGKVKAASSGDLLEMFISWLSDKRLKMVTPADIRSFMKASARSESSATYLIKKAIAAKILKHKGKGKGTYYDVKLPFRK